jgi:Fe-S oxidoreductase/predicted DNA-binding transcriptional regulator YafY
MSKASRLQRLEEMLVSTTEGLTLSELTELLSVHRTTVWRDLNELSLRAPVQHIDKRYLIDRTEYLSNVRLDSAESLMLYLGLRRVLRSPAHCPPLLLLALEKLSLGLRDQSGAKLVSLIDKIRVRRDPDQEQIWETLVRAWLEKISVRIQYQEYEQSVVEEVEVQPFIYEPAMLGEGVYLVGRCAHNDQIRTFSVERILRAVLTTQHFEKPDDSFVDSMLKTLWSTWSGDSQTEVRLRFHDPMVIRRVRRTIWIPGQEIRELPNGEIEWTASVPDVFELVPWIRGWGPACEIVAPEELAERVNHVEQYLGGVTMTTGPMPKTASFSEEFYESLFEVLDGERIRTCLQCSSCSGICPFGFVMDFHPRKMISALRANSFDMVMESDAAWMCVSCYACSEVCPAKIPITVGLMTRVKEEKIMSGDVPSELRDAMKHSERYGNPMGESARKRAEWTKGLEPEVPIMAKADRPVDVLWFVGDYGSYHPRVQQTTRALARILHALEIDFGILGPEEKSDGDSQRMAGERGLFELLAEENGKALSKYTFNEIITADPHAYNALKNEYPALGIEYPVRHYTEYLADRLEDLKPYLKHEVAATVAFHDPCYLGRVNEIFDQPRELLKAIPGVELVEMAHSREASLCCGGGGGGMWLDGFQWERANVRLSEWRVREAVVASGADRMALRPPIPEKKKRSRANDTPSANGAKRILAIACPYEAPRFEDAAKMVEGASRLVVKDIAELLAEAMGD